MNYKQNYILTGKRRLVSSGEMHFIQCSVPAKTDEIYECRESFGTSGSAEVIACCKGKGVPEDCIKYCEI